MEGYEADCCFPVDRFQIESVVVFMLNKVINLQIVQMRGYYYAKYEKSPSKERLGNHRHNR